MIYLSIVGLITISIYVVVMAIIHGIQEYVSDDFYVGYNKWLFSLVIVFAAFSQLPHMLEVAEPIGILGLAMCFGLSLVGAEPHYKSIHGKKAHNIGAYTALISGGIWSLLTNPYPLLICGAIYGILVLCTKIGKKYPYYFGECLGMLGIMLSSILA